jgi:GNAT superfamily N-acetyltransferase
LPEEWDVFRHWAASEGWRVPVRELSLYRNEFADSAFVLRDGASAPLGFVTVCRQQCSAWIGNLIVDPAQRGMGYGRQLFQHAVSTLSTRGVGMLWLTASADGRPLYENCGFRETGRVERWVWSGVGLPGKTCATPGAGELFTLVRADAAAWGHSRAELLSLLACGGRVLSSGSTVALLQPGDDLCILGPWLSADLCPRANRMVLMKTLESFSGAGEIAVDILGGSPVRPLLHAAGFRQCGETVLMMRGGAERVRFRDIVALASLGSMG